MSSVKYILLHTGNGNKIVIRKVAYLKKLDNFSSKSFLNFGESYTMFSSKPVYLIKKLILCLLLSCDASCMRKSYD